MLNIIQIREKPVLPNSERGGDIATHTPHEVKRPIVKPTAEIGRGVCAWIGVERAAFRRRRAAAGRPAESALEVALLRAASAAVLGAVRVERLAA